MKAIQVEYRHTLSKGYPSYTNETVGLTMAVDSFERADDVLEAARQWVHKKLGVTPKQEEIPF